MRRQFLPGLRGSAEYWLWRYGLRRLKRLSQPLNGQRQRRQIVEDLIRAVDIQLIVETGTYLGTTAAYLATQFALPLYTVESNHRFYAFAKLRLRSLPKVTALRGDSRSFLRHVAQDPKATAARTLFYLDAHWHDDLPLRSEIEIVMQSWKNAVIMIDDFAVPDDPGYRYDDYGPGAVLNMELIRPMIDAGLTAFFPSASSASETGCRRGCVVLGTVSHAEELRNVPSLQSLSQQHHDAA